ncbi:DUF4199 domain-containing protein [Mucilaginibacter sp. HMF5004]|uniref:DUF4199 domain-containing protein n=1 Tax=Mucilaginibacter rivuli TaxID=2857527 RepID=UPI001C5F456B|nr:DUF4199 domain-containing protein [Mucilaginibacter rivuli]MBW4890362.1 DUF4199 domain-containing protein [Mucilaginibacter rivuli]
MKTTLISGAFIGVLSAIWIFAMHASGITTQPAHDFTAVELTAALIPLLGLYFGVRAYRDTVNGGIISFLEALIESFKILLVGGIIAVAAAIVYIDYVSAGSIIDFSGQIFGALLLGLLFSLAVSLVVMNKHKAI